MHHMIVAFGGLLSILKTVQSCRREVEEMLFAVRVREASRWGGGASTERRNTRRKPARHIAVRVRTAGEWAGGSGARLIRCVAGD